MGRTVCLMRISKMKNVSADKERYLVIIICLGVCLIEVIHIP